MVGICIWDKMVIKFKKIGIILFSCLYLFSLFLIVFVPYVEAGWGNEFNDSFEDGDYTLNPVWESNDKAFKVEDASDNGVPDRDGTYVLRSNASVSTKLNTSLSGALSVDTHLSFSTYFNDSTVRKLQIALAPTGACNNGDYAGMTFQANGLVQYLVADWQNTNCTYSADTWDHWVMSANPPTGRLNITKNGVRCATNLEPDWTTTNVANVCMVNDRTTSANNESYYLDMIRAGTDDPSLTFVEDDSSAPTFGNETNATGIGVYQNITMNITISDATDIANYTFSWNGTGTALQYTTEINSTFEDSLIDPYWHPISSGVWSIVGGDPPFGKSLKLTPVEDELASLGIYHNFTEGEYSIGALEINLSMNFTITTINNTEIYLSSNNGTTSLPTENMMVVRYEDGGKVRYVPSNGSRITTNCTYAGYPPQNWSFRVDPALGKFNITKNGVSCHQELPFAGSGSTARSFNILGLTHNQVIRPVFFDDINISHISTLSEFTNDTTVQLAGTQTTWNANVSKNLTINIGTPVAWKYYACDSSNRCVVSGTFNFTVGSAQDKDPPTLSSPANDTGIKKNQNITMNITISDATDIANYTFSWNNSGSFVNDTPVQLAGTQTTWNANISKNITANELDIVSWRFYACDSGNFCDVSATSTFNVSDATNPSVTLDSPSNTSSNSNGTVLFKFTPTDNIGLKNASLYSNATGAWGIINSTTSLTNNTQSTLGYTINATGKVIWNVRIYDNGINSAFAANNFTTTIISNIAPTITRNVSVPLSPINSNTSVYLSVNVSDPDSDRIFYVNFTLVYPNGTKITDNVNGTTSDYLVWNSSALSTNVAGIYLWNFTVADNNTNSRGITTSSQLNFSVLTNTSLVNSAAINKTTSVFLGTWLLITSEVIPGEGTNTSYVNFTVVGPDSKTILNKNGTYTVNNIWNSTAFRVNRTGTYEVYVNSSNLQGNTSTKRIAFEVASPTIIVTPSKYIESLDPKGSNVSFNITIRVDSPNAEAYNFTYADYEGLNATYFNITFTPNGDNASMASPILNASIRVDIPTNLNTANKIYATNISIRGRVPGENELLFFSTNITVQIAVNPPAGNVSISRSDNVMCTGSLCNRFDEMTTSEVKSYNFLVNNTGAYQLRACNGYLVNDFASKGFWAASPTNFTVEANASQAVTVLYDPSEETGTFQGDFLANCTYSTTSNTADFPDEANPNNRPFVILKINPVTTTTGGGGGGTSTPTIVVTPLVNISKEVQEILAKAPRCGDLVCQDKPEMGATTSYKESYNICPKDCPFFRKSGEGSRLFINLLVLGGGALAIVSFLNLQKNNRKNKRKKKWT